MTGKIKKLISDKGFGFITSPELPQKDGRDADMFFHSSAVTGDTRFDGLREGDSVSFETQQGSKGLQGANVQKIEAGQDEAGEMAA